MATLSPKSLEFKILREIFALMHNKMEIAFTLMIGSNLCTINDEFATLGSKQGLLLSQ